MKKRTLFIVLAVLMTSCTQRACQSNKREFQTSDRQYDIKVYSGGKLIRHDNFRGIVNQEDSSDGMYYFKGDSLIETGGQYVIISSK